MAIEQQQFHFNSSSFTDPKWAPSLFTNDDDVFPNDLLESLLTQQSSAPPVSAPVSERESPVLNQVLKQEQRYQPAGGRGTKRKSRASKRAATTFITADVSNFRQMVQQVTGIQAATSSEVPVVVKPEPSYNVTTPFVLDGDYFMNGFVPQQQQPATVVEGGGFFYDGLCTFPTLESWKV